MMDQKCKFLLGSIFFLLLFAVQAHASATCSSPIQKYPKESGEYCGQSESAADIACNQDYNNAQVLYQRQLSEYSNCIDKSNNEGLVCFTPIQAYPESRGQYCGQHESATDLACNKNYDDSQVAYQKQVSMYNVCIEKKNSAENNTKCQTALDALGGNGISTYDGQQKFNGCRISCNKGYYLVASGECFHQNDLQTPILVEGQPKVTSVVESASLPQIIQSPLPVPITAKSQVIPSPVIGTSGVVAAASKNEVNTSTTSLNEQQAGNNEIPPVSFWSRFSVFLSHLDPFNWFK